MPDRKILECAFAVKGVEDSGQFEGHAAVFGNVDFQGDKIKRGAFKETLEASGGRWPILMGHSMGRVVGFSTAAEEDSKGLYVEGEFTLASDEGRNAYATVKHAAALGQKFGLSIGYMIPDGGASYDEQTNVRTLKNIHVFEFSLAAVPANDRARMTRVKDLADCRTVRDVEVWLKEHGATGDEARQMISVCRLERDAKAEGGDLERDAKDAQAFIAALRGEEFTFQLKGI